ncbi:MAG: zinc ribbon domain-containing protein [Candidatus Lokiarchaeota archaeon]|nr:zinc ribbon domain-containing protein [Candidatus Lokiarchaeota archaeon]
MYCNSCGQKLPEGTIKCSYCGNLIERTSNTQTRAPQVIHQSSETYAPVHIQDARPTYPCPRCGSTAPKEKAYKIWIQIICILCGILVGLVYYLLRHNTVKCPDCGKVF